MHFNDFISKMIKRRICRDNMIFCKIKAQYQIKRLLESYDIFIIAQDSLSTSFCFN